MNTNKNNEYPYMSVENLKDLLEQFQKFLYDIHQININNIKEFNIKKILFDLMNHISNTKHGKTLQLKELNVITLKTLRDYINKNFSDIFKNKKQVSILDREQSVSKKKTNVPPNFMNNNTNNIPNRDISSEYDKFSKERTININKKKDVDFEIKKDSILTQDDFTNKIKELEMLRKDPSMKIESPKSDKIPTDKIDVKFEQNNLISNNVLPQNNLESNDLLGFDINDMDEDNFSSFNSIDTSTTPTNVPENISYTPTIPENISYTPTISENISYTPTIPENISYTPTISENISYTPTIPANSLNNEIINEDKLIENLFNDNINLESPNLESPNLESPNLESLVKKQKIIISSIKRDTDLFRSSTEYKIKLKNPIHNITKIKLVNCIIKINKLKNNINFLIFKLNDFNMISSNDTNINDSFAILSDNKLYNDEIVFNPPLNILTEFKINILDKYGKLFIDENNNNIFEFIIEFK
jgi:hypothetical protein